MSHSIAALLRAWPLLLLLSGGVHFIQALSSSFAVVGYLPEYTAGYPKWDKVDFEEQCAHLTHLIIFSIEVAPEGGLQALDRVPPAAALVQLTAAATRHATKVQICFGGYGRTQGFPEMTSTHKRRRRFISRLVKFIDRHGFHGVDYNWEYPRDQAEWSGLSNLIVETRGAFHAAGHPDWVVSMAYYPDGRQEQLLSHMTDVDYFHSMAYDARGRHSTFLLAQQTVQQAARWLPLAKVTLGLPLYSRHIKTGHWKSYRSLVEAHGDAVLHGDELAGDFYNGVEMIRRKTALARQMGLGGVMIWESGLDVPTTDVRSLLRTIRLVVEKPEETSTEESDEL
eukprot:GGOE01042993.1.p1 GENE.GGOE01042993.1~~GGOE01042993.1.p1  ORF type:complete len:359 (-),score=79.99 GGOE01042993.1:182-1198(-)